MTIEQVKMQYMMGKYDIDFSAFNTTYLDNGYVFDENKSVKWNREQVKEFNRGVPAEIRRRKEAQIQKDEEFKSDCIRAIRDDYNFGEGTANKIFVYCYAKYHSNMYEFFDNVEDIAELAHDIFVN